MPLRWIIVTVAIFVDIAIMSAALILLKKKGLLQNLGAGIAKSRALAVEARDLCGNYLRANYSGNPDDLPPLLDQLLAQLDEKAKENGATLTRPMLKLVLETSLQNQDGVPLRDVQAALRKVA